MPLSNHQTTGLQVESDFGSDCEGQGDGSSEDDSAEEVQVEIDLDGEGRIAGTRDSGLDLSSFRAWHGLFSSRSSPGAAGTQAAVDVVRKDCEILWAIEELHAESFLLPASWDAKRPQCSLEKLAKEVFDFHTKGCYFEPDKSGAEWWVQIRGGCGQKEPQKESVNRKRAADDETVKKEAEVSGIGFHWDKDEDLVDQLEVQVNPQISTVTYLTDDGAPTMVLSKLAHTNYADSKRMYHGGIKEGWLSHPKTGKHIAFDGRLLHGAPKRLVRVGTEGERRITFLVNIWLNYLPVGLEPLPGKHAQRLSTVKIPRILVLPDVQNVCEEEEQLVRRRTSGGLWISEPFGPTGTEHVLEFPWPRREVKGGHGVVKFRFAAGSEARILPAHHGRRCPQ